MGTALPTSIPFDGTALHILDRDGKPWLSATTLSRALGYEDTSAVTRIYGRHEAEFTDAMTGTVNLTVPNQSRKVPVRIFSPRGCHLVAMFSRTPKAAAFRRWVLDVLEGLAQPPAPPATTNLNGLDMPPAVRELIRGYLEGMLERFCGRTPAEVELAQMRSLVDRMKQDMRQARLAMSHAEARAKQLESLPHSRSSGRQVFEKLRLAEKALTRKPENHARDDHDAGKQALEEIRRLLGD